MHIVEFIGRVLLSALFLIEGFGKISMQEDVIMYMEDYGVPEYYLFLQQFLKFYFLCF